MPPKRVTTTTTPITTPKRVASTTIDLSKLSADGQAIVALMKDEFSKMESKFMDILSQKNEMISGLQTKVTELEHEVNNLKTLVDDADAYERRDTVILSGAELPSAQLGENCTGVLISTVKDKLNIIIDRSDISVAHRLGKKPTTQGPDKRPIIAKLCRRETKHSLISASRRTKAPGFFINESLSPQRSSIFKTMRKIRKEHPDVVKGCNTHDGKVQVYTPAASTNSLLPPRRDIRHTINTHDDLTRFCREYVKKPLEFFLQK